MMSGRFKYTMLMTSLPPHKRNLFSTRQTPVSEIQLKKRLQWLQAEDAGDLAKIQNLLYWSKLKDDTDCDVVQHSHQLLETIDNPFLKEVIRWRLELRTLIAALRKRHQGKKLPDIKEQVPGFGKWPYFIRRNWLQPDFGLGKQLPWLREANRMIEQNQCLELEKMLLTRVWRHYEHMGNGHYFDFEAVIIYVLRWDVIQRWNGYDRLQAVTRFTNIVDKSLQGVL